MAVRAAIPQPYPPAHLFRNASEVGRKRTGVYVGKILQRGIMEVLRFHGTLETHVLNPRQVLPDVFGRQ